MADRKNVLFNSVGVQNLSSPHQLDIRLWNNTINSLALQGNDIARYIKDFDNTLQETVDEVKQDLTTTINEKLEDAVEDVVTDISTNVNERFNTLIANNLLEHNYYISPIDVSEICSNVWYANDDRIVAMRDGLSITIVVPVTTNKELTLYLSINNLQQGRIIYDINNPSKPFILKEGAIVQLIGLYINSTYYFVVISDSKSSSSSIHFGNTEGEQLEGALWYDTNNNTNQ